MIVSSSRRILSVWLRRLPTDRIARSSPALADAPLVTVAIVKSARRIATLNDAAEKLGLHTGMALADARAMYPSLAAADADPNGDRNALEAIADWCDRYTPLVGLDEPDGLVLDITGCAHLFGGEAALCRDLAQRLVAQGLHVRLAVADSTGCAWGVARYGTPGLVPPGATRETIAPLPLAALRLAPETVVALAQSGLKRVADVLALPRAPLAARFGTDFIRRIDQALGIDEESIVPRLPLPSYLVERRFADPIAREEDVLGMIGHLADELARILERQGEGAWRLQVALFRADGKVTRVEVGTGAPLRDPERILRLFTERLAVLADECDPGFGFDMVRLSVLASERLDPQQTGLDRPDEARELSHLIDRLSARFGARAVQRLVPQDTHIPEFACVAVAAQSFSGDGASLTRSAASGTSDEHDSLVPARPLRMFARPEPIEAIAEVPDGPPVRFRWRHVVHEVMHAEGPERIAMEWWRDRDSRALTRDYFRIESRTGLRAWLYREGLYGREPGHSRWFLHGLFA
jgi:protein ImuB